MASLRDMIKMMQMQQNRMMGPYRQGRMAGPYRQKAQPRKIVESPQEYGISGPYGPSYGVPDLPQSTGELPELENKLGNYASPRQLGYTPPIPLGAYTPPRLFNPAPYQEPQGSPITETPQEFGMPGTIDTPLTEGMAGGAEQIPIGTPQVPGQAPRSFGIPDLPQSEGELPELNQRFPFRGTKVKSKWSRGAADLYG